MKVIVVGGGKVGYRIVEDLSAEGHDITVIDEKQSTLELILTNQDVQGILGSGTNYDIQIKAETDKCDMFIAVTSSDEINIISAIMAKKLGAKYTVARARSKEYFSHWDFMRDSLGVNSIINPEFEAAKSINMVLRFPSALMIDQFSNKKTNVIEFTVPATSKLVGVSIKFLNQYSKANIIICAVERGDSVFISKGDYIIEAGDRICITGAVNHLTLFLKDIGAYKRKINSVFIIGGGKIGYYLLKQLPKSMDIKIIDHDEKVCEDLSLNFPHVTVICGDGTHQDLLMEEELPSYDACVMLTGIDEENILMSMFANMHKVPKIITKINRQGLLDIVGKHTLQTVITPKAIIADKILQVIRSKMNISGNNVLTLHKIANDQVEVLEFKITDGKEIVNIPLKDLPIKAEALLIYILRGTTIIYPKGNDCIEKNDRVLVATTLPHINDILHILEK